MQSTTITQLASLHSIDNTDTKTVRRDIRTNDALDYVTDLIQETQDNPNKRFFKFKNDTAPVLEYIHDIFNQIDDVSILSIFHSNCEKIATRLLSAEQNSIQKYPTMPHPRKGNLIITADNSINELTITLAKIESADFLENINLQMQSGLPKNKKALKTAVINITKEDESAELEVIITITDSNTTISKYWSDDFLEAVELTSDEKNTKNAFSSIEKILSRNLQNKASSDYTELRNNLVGYFKTQPAYHHEQMIQHVFGTYQMINTNVDLQKVKNQVNELIEKDKFDTHFTIISKEIKARFKKSYKVSDSIELRTMGHIKDLRHIIRATENKLGEKILEIKIENDRLYESFNFNTDTETNNS
ncbi:hypothetical protein A0U40_03645 [[Bacillus] sp. KCTC 13219]|nr:hypothetical protein A0U40_03645 [[Bacillus] sp. KCTC 13219]